MKKNNIKKTIKRTGLSLVTASVLATTALSLPVTAEPAEYDYAAEQAAAEEAARIAAEQAAAEEAARIAAEQAAAEEAARIAAEQAAAEEAARQAAEQAAAEEAAWQAAEQAAAEEAARQAAEQAAAEEAARQAQEAAEAQAQAAAEEAARQEQERLQAEQAAAQQQTTAQQPETSTQAQTTVGTMTVSIASQVPRYIVQNVPFELKLRITGGKAPYSIQAGDNQAAVTASAEGEVTVATLMNTIGKDRKLDIRVTDADGTTAILQASLPVTGSKVADWDVINAIMDQITLKETWAENLLIIARSQLGSGESTENFIIDDKGRFFGYTQYGLWQNSYYEEWSAGFLDFCLHYARIGEKMLPYAATASEWPASLGNLYKPAGTSAGSGAGSEVEYVPKAGDLIFLHVNDSRQEETPLTVINHVGIITAVTEDAIATIEGNVGGSVKECLYTRDENGAYVDAARGGIVLGYADMEQAEEEYREKLAEEAAGEQGEEGQEPDVDATEEANAAEDEDTAENEDSKDAGSLQEADDSENTATEEAVAEDAETGSEEASEQAGEETEENNEEEAEDETASTEYTVEAEGMLFTIIPEDPEAMPEGTTVRVEFLDEQESHTLAAELLEPMERENQKFEVKQARSMRIVFTDPDGKEFQPATALRVSMTGAKGAE